MTTPSVSPTEPPRAKRPLEIRAASSLTTSTKSAVVTELIRAHGPAVRAHLSRTLRVPQDAEDAYSAFCETLWCCIDDLRSERGLRTWCLRVAHRKAIDIHRVSKRRQGQRDQLAVLSEFTAPPHDETPGFMRTMPPDVLSEAMASLSAEDRGLLKLRLEQQLPWVDIAAIALGQTDARASATMRKRYQRVVEQLRRRLLDAKT